MNNLLREQLIPVSSEPELRLLTEHGTLTAQVSISRPKAGIEMIEDQGNTPDTHSEVFMETPPEHFQKYFQKPMNRTHEN